MPEKRTEHIRTSQEAFTIEVTLDNGSLLTFNGFYQLSENCLRIFTIEGQFDVVRIFPIDTIAKVVGKRKRL